MWVNPLQGTHDLNLQSLITFVGKVWRGNQIHTASSALHHRRRRHNNLSQPPVNPPQREQQETKNMDAALKSW